MRHRWFNNKCMFCGCERNRLTWKRRMAIVNNKDVYQYGTSMAYSFDGFKTWEFKAGECEPETIDEYHKRV